jgi:hypothetical protein
LSPPALDAALGWTYALIDAASARPGLGLPAGSREGWWVLSLRVDTVLPSSAVAPLTVGAVTVEGGGVRWTRRDPGPVAGKRP